MITNTGEEALTEYKKALDNGVRFDVVILDLAVPGGMGGKEVMKSLLKMDPNARVLVSSGDLTDRL